MGWYPCQPCCRKAEPSTCVILRDDFNRSEIGNDWTIVSGGWQIAGNAYLESTLGDSVILDGVTSPDNAPKLAQVRVNPQGSAGIIFSDAFADNWVGARLTIGSQAVFQLVEQTTTGGFRILASVDLLPISGGDWHLIYVCYVPGSAISEGRVHGRVETSTTGQTLTLDYQYQVADPEPYGSAHGGLYSWNQGDAFDDFNYEYAYDATLKPLCTPCAEGGTCQWCIGGNWPQQLNIDVPAITLDDGDCTDCFDLEGNYVVDKNEPGGETCEWSGPSIPFSTSDCEGTVGWRATLFRALVDGVGLLVELVISVDGNVQIMYWIHWFQTQDPVDCLNWDNLVCVPDGYIGPQHCDHQESGQVLITSVSP